MNVGLLKADTGGHDPDNDRTVVNGGDGDTNAMNDVVRVQLQCNDHDDHEEQQQEVQQRYGLRSRTQLQRPERYR